MRVSLLWNACFLACGMSRGLGKCPECLEECLRKSRCHTHTHVGHKARPPLCNLSRLLRRVAPPAAAAAHTVSCAAGRQMAVAAAPSTKRAIVAPRAATKFPPPPCEWAVRFSECLAVGPVCARSARFPGPVSWWGDRVSAGSNPGGVGCFFFFLDGSPPTVGVAVGDVTTPPRGGTRRRVCGIFRSHLGER